MDFAIAVTARHWEEVYGKACIGVQHVRKWCREFSEGHSDVHDEQGSGMPLIEHTPYSHDLTPSEFHLFPKLKQHLGGQRFRKDEGVKEGVIKFIGGQAAEIFEACFQKWIIRQ
ncbi:hypothetical protein GWI33_005498 [Rhynchophorus ferrugineus]|uniref:Uncharacterized protein n=1 Tax=Rhynchophorus ferrugineus TaxID=354439 RepID=A0A834MJI6_RHYFE|nr:hypothetical protein GWI33_005498 [Rhynchophorus ferrugineus]